MISCTKDAALFDTAADVKWLSRAAIELHLLGRAVEGVNHDLKFLWATDLRVPLWPHKETMANVDLSARGGGHIVTPGRYAPPAAGGGSV